MARLTATLLDYLCIPNPELDCSRCPSGSRTTQGKFTYSSPVSVLDWPDFSFQTLSQKYSGSFESILKHRYDFQDYSDISKLPHRRIFDEASLESFLDIWNWRMVSEALATAQGHDDKHPAKPPIFMAKGGHTWFPGIVVSRNGKPLKPDWAGFKELPESSGKPPNILPGDTKLSSKWHSSRIRTGRVVESGNIDGWLPAIRQIYTYCTRANAQYGYLITDQELVAVKISWLACLDNQSPEEPKDGESTHRQRKGLLLFKAIPWDHDVVNPASGLSMNLALWWLHMMAAADHEVKDEKLALEDLEEALTDSQDSQTRGRQTPPISEDQGSFGLEHVQSFHSDISDVRHTLSAAALDQDSRQASPTAAASRRKRTRGKQDAGGDHGHTRRRVNRSRSSKR
ncbi:MAG: hypothetical protein Q9222_002782 [Ikaeria aurantiellina]